MNLLQENLISWIRNTYSPEERTKTSKDGKQTLFFRKSSKSLCYIDTQNGNSIVTIVIGTSLQSIVQSANISPKTKEMFLKAKQFHDGKWLFLNLITQSDLDDITILLNLKKNILPISRYPNKS